MHPLRILFGSAIAAYGLTAIIHHPGLFSMTAGALMLVSGLAMTPILEKYLGREDCSGIFVLGMIGSSVLFFLAA